MAKNQNKTQAGNEAADSVLAKVTPEQKQQDCRRIDEMMQEATGCEAKVWGGSMLGYGQYHYRYDSGREGDFFITGFAPRAKNISLYIMAGFSRYDDLMAKLGKYKTGKSCLYINKLADVDEQVLAALISESVAWMREKYPD